MATQQIRLTYLWADESVLLEDFQKKISKRMTDWANEFYQQYQFELHVLPDKPKSAADATRFALKKNDGVSPDLDLDRRLDEKLAEEKPKLEKQIQQKEKEIAQLDAAIAAKKVQEQQLTAALAAVPANDIARRNEIMLEAIGVLEAITTLLNQSTGKRGEISKLRAQMDALDAQAATERAKNDYASAFRVQMRDKFLNDNIGDEKRLNVVFCKFKRRAFAMRGFENLNVIGQTQLQISALIPSVLPVTRPSVVARLFLWPYPYLIIDIGKADPNTLAHEIVHAAGHLHPPARTIVKSLETRIKGVRLGQGSVFAMKLEFEEVPRYQEVPGGYFDGAANDIMNYSAKGEKPSDFILADADKKLLDSARFVVP